jgi:hypothetical protein
MRGQKLWGISNKTCCNCYAGTAGIFLMSETFKRHKRQTAKQRYKCTLLIKKTLLGIIVDIYKVAIGIVLMLMTFKDNDLIAKKWSYTSTLFTTTVLHTLSTPFSLLYTQHCFDSGRTVIYHTACVDFLVARVDVLVRTALLNHLCHSFVTCNYFRTKLISLYSVQYI